VAPWVRTRFYRLGWSPRTGATKVLQFYLKNICYIGVFYAYFMPDVPVAERQTERNKMMDSLFFGGIKSTRSKSKNERKHETESNIRMLLVFKQIVLLTKFLRNSNTTMLLCSGMS